MNYYIYDDENLNIIEEFLADVLTLFWKRFSLNNEIPDMEYSYFRRAVSDCFYHLLLTEKYSKFASSVSSYDLDVIYGVAIKIINKMLYDKDSGLDDLNLFS